MRNILYSLVIAFIPSLSFYVVFQKILTEINTFLVPTIIFTILYFINLKLFKSHKESVVKWSWVLVINLLIALIPIIIIIISRIMFLCFGGWC